MKRLLPALIVVHRYLGLAFCLIFLVWFASGVVMVFKRMPEYSDEERLSRLPPLDAGAIRLAPAEALAAAELPAEAQHVRLTTLRSRPLYRIEGPAGAVGVFADNGELLEEVKPDDAFFIVGDLFAEYRDNVRYVGSLRRPDQWTFNNRFLDTGALHKIALYDQASTELYVAETSGEIVMKTDRSSRMWGYLGPVLHWFYFTPLRLRGSLWYDLIVYGSIVGCALCVLGLVIGVYRFSVERRYQRGASYSPYTGWLRWHHYAGLLFGVITLTWTFSGLLTMTPWNLFPSGGPAPEHVYAARGDSLAFDRFVVSPAQGVAAFERTAPVKELELTQFMGSPLYAVYSGALPVFVAADGPTPRLHRGYGRDQLLAAARGAMAGLEPVEAAWLTEFDAYYYDRPGGNRRLPVLRAKFNDPDLTWLYLDAVDGSVLLAEVKGSRAERWLYQGLHSLDFPGLYQTRWAWYAVIIGLSVGGTALSLTSISVAWRPLRDVLRFLRHNVARPA